MPSLVDLLVREINEVDGVDVEEVRVVADGAVDPWLDALEAAAQLVGAASADELLDSLCDRAFRAVGSRLGGGGRASTAGASVAVARHAAQRGLAVGVRRGQPGVGPPRRVGTRWGDDVTWVPLPSTGLALILGREGTAFRAKERRQVAALARIADAWLCEHAAAISRLAGRLAPPAPGARPAVDRPRCPRSGPVAGALDGPLPLGVGGVGRGPARPTGATSTSSAQWPATSSRMLHTPAARPAR